MWTDVHRTIKENGKQRSAWNDSKSEHTKLEISDTDRKSTRLNSSHSGESRMPSSA